MGGKKEKKKEGGGWGVGRGRRVQELHKAVPVEMGGGGGGRSSPSEGEKYPILITDRKRERFFPQKKKKKKRGENKGGKVRQKGKKGEPALNITRGRHFMFLMSQKERRRGGKNLIDTCGQKCSPLKGEKKGRKRGVTGKWGCKVVFTFLSYDRKEEKKHKKGREKLKRLGKEREFSSERKNRDGEGEKVSV